MVDVEKKQTGSVTSHHKQLTLDLGQRLRVECRECGMSYDRSEVADVAVHRQFHRTLTHGVRCGGTADWGKCARAMRHLGDHVLPAKAVNVFFGSGGVLAKEGVDRCTVGIWRLDLASVAANDPGTSAVRRFFRLAVGQMDAALGSVPLEGQEAVGKTLLMAQLDGRIVATALFGSAWKERQVDQRPEQTPPPPLALYRIHVVPAFRRAGLASALLDAALDSCVYGMAAKAVIDRYGSRARSIAFCQPTESGRRLAEAWAYGRKKAVALSHPLIVFEQS